MKTLFMLAMIAPLFPAAAEACPLLDGNYECAEKKEGSAKVPVQVVHQARSGAPIFIFSYSNVFVTANGIPWDNDWRGEKRVATARCSGKELTVQLDTQPDSREIAKWEQLDEAGRNFRLSRTFSKLKAPDANAEASDSRMEEHECTRLDPK